MDRIQYKRIEGIFEGEISYMLKKWDKVDHLMTSIGTCNADDKWEALDKFQRMELTKTKGFYKITTCDNALQIAFWER